MFLLVIRCGKGAPLALEPTGQIKLQDGKPYFTSEHSEENQPSSPRQPLDASNHLLI
jgi:hypothetical protein